MLSVGCWRVGVLFVAGVNWCCEFTVFPHTKAKIGVGADAVRDAAAPLASPKTFYSKINTYSYACSYINMSSF
jgi:hypothetical protein